MALSPPSWVVGSPARVTITVDDPGIVVPPTAGEAKLMVSAHRNAGGAEPRRVIQGLAAVVPPVPVAELPTYALEDTGEIVQAVRMSTLADGTVDSVYFYAMADSAEHMPDDATPYVLRYADTSGGSPDVNPSEHGSFTAPPVITFNAKYANVTPIFECSSDDSMYARSWTGPNGAVGQLHPQAGADLVREASYLCRPHDPGNGNLQVGLASSATGAIGMIDFCVRQYAGDDAVFLVEGRFLNATYDSAEDVHATNTKADGRINLEYLNVTVPAGWVVDLGPYPNPVATQTAAAATMSLVATATNSYLVNPAQRFGFWFVVRRATTAAQERGEDYLLSKNIAWAVGSLGSTRQPIYGDNAVLTFDHGRYGTQFIGNPGAPLASPPAPGWEVIKWVGENQAGLKSGDTGFGGWGANWAAGSSSSETSGRPRTGLWHLPGSPTQGPTGFSGSHPMGALIAHWGWWDRTRYMHEYGMQRAACAARDTTDGSAAWWWRTLRVGGADDGKVGLINTIGYSTARRRLVTQNWRGMLDEGAARNHIENPEWYVAPDTNAWNLPDFPPASTDLDINTGLGVGAAAVELAAPIPGTPPDPGVLLITADSGAVYPYGYDGYAGSAFLGDGTWSPPSNETFTDGIAKVSFGAMDTTWDTIEKTPPLSFTHLGYIRTGLNDGWYCCRRYNEYRDWEEVAATSSRSAIPHSNFSRDATGSMSTVFRKHGYGSILDTRSDPIYGAPFYQSGEHFGCHVPGTTGTASWHRTTHQISQLRGYARTLQFMSGFAAIGEAQLRVELVEAGPDESSPTEAYVVSNYAGTGNDIPRVASTIYRMHAFLEFVTTPGGLVGSEFAIEGSPNPYSVGTSSSRFQAPDLAQRRGAWPHETNVASGQTTPPMIAAGQHTFHQGYMTNTLGGVYARTFQPGVFNFPTNSAAFAWLDNVLTGRNNSPIFANSGPGWDNFPYFVCSRLDDYPTAQSWGSSWTGGEGGNNFEWPLGHEFAPVSAPLSSVQAGDISWTFRRGPATEPDWDYYGELHKWKASGNAFYAMRHFNWDYGYVERYVGRVFGGTTGGGGLPGTTKQEILDYFMRHDSPLGATSVEGQLTRSGGASTGGYWSFSYSSNSCMMNMPLLAWLNNEVNP